MVLPGSDRQAARTPGARRRRDGRRHQGRMDRRDAGRLDLRHVGGVTPRAGFDLAVTRAPEENLRAAPGGTIVAKLAEGFLLTKLGENGPWVHVERAGWVKRAALEPVVVANSRTAGDSDSLQARLTPGRR